MDYEIFCDSSYYDMWCVRPKGSTSFNDPLNRHFNTEEEAKAYKELAEKQEDNIADVRRSFSKTYQKGTEITDDALIFINDTLQQMTVENENGYREFKAKVRITFNYA